MSKVEFFWVVAGKAHDSLASAKADQDELISDGYQASIEKYAYIDREVYSAEEGERELQFQSDMRLAEERNRLIDFYG